MTIKFNKFNVTNTATGKKARVHYSVAARIDGRKAVTLYAKDYGHELRDVFNGEAVYQNNTEILTDYFETGRVVFFEGDKFYPAAMATAQALEAKRAAKYN